MNHTCRYPFIFFFLSFFSFLTWTSFKVFIDFVTTLLLFLCSGFLATRHAGILAPRPGIEPTPSALEGSVLAPGPPGKPLSFYLTDSWRALAVSRDLQWTLGESGGTSKALPVERTVEGETSCCNKVAHHSDSLSTTQPMKRGVVISLYR